MHFLRSKQSMAHFSSCQIQSITGLQRRECYGVSAATVGLIPQSYFVAEAGDQAAFNDERKATAETVELPG